MVKLANLIISVDFRASLICSVVKCNTLAEIDL